MKLQFIPEFTVMGKLGEGASSEAATWVVLLWDRANADYAQISGSVLKNVSGSPKGMWGIMGNPSEYLGRWTERGLYLAGCEVEKDAAVPDGWTKWTVPAQTYLVADPTQEQYGEVFRKVLEEYLPQHGLKMVGAAHEHYPDPGNPNKLEIYFPIAKGNLYCQSCGMPMTEEEHLGTCANGEPDYDYCCYCRKNGAFTDSRTMEEMIDFCLQYDKENNGMSEKDAEQARKNMLQWFPTLKRWKAENH